MGVTFEIKTMKLIIFTLATVAVVFGAPPAEPLAERAYKNKKEARVARQLENAPLEDAVKLATYKKDRQARAYPQPPLEVAAPYPAGPLSERAYRKKKEAREARQLENAPLEDAVILATYKKDRQARAYPYAPLEVAAPYPAGPLAERAYRKKKEAR